MKDPDIRKILIPSLTRQFPKARIIQEMGLYYTSIVDVCVINPSTFEGYEIKSDHDTLARLPRQMEAYNAVFDIVTLVVGKHHLDSASTMIPDWWGVILVDGVLKAIREPKINPSIQWDRVAKLLWNDESQEILERYGCARGVRGKSKNCLAERMASSLTPKQIQFEVCNALRERKYTDAKRSEVIDCWNIPATATPAPMSATSASDT